MDPITTSFLTNILSTAIYSSIRNSGNKVLNSVFDQKSIDELILSKADFETIIEENIAFEDFPEIIKMEGFPKFLRTREVSDIIQRIFEFSSLTDHNVENLDDLRSEFSLLFIRFLGLEKDDLFTLGSQLFDVLIEACHRALSDTIRKDETLFSHEGLSKYRGKVLYDGQGRIYEEILTVNRNIKTVIDNSSEELLESEYQAQLEPIKKSIKHKNPTLALESIEILKNRIWDKSSFNVKYNLLRLEASAKLLLNKYKEAGSILLEARQYNSEDEKAVVNAAFGFLLLGDKSSSRDLALEVLEKNPTNDNAHSILIQIGFEDDIEKIPSYMKENQNTAYALGNHFYKKGNIDEAKKYLKIAIENEEENILEIRPFLASILIDRVLSDSQSIPGFQLNAKHKFDIEESVDLFTFAWDSISDHNLKILHVDWILKKAVAKRLLGDLEGAEVDINFAFEINSSDPEVLYFKALLEFEHGEFEKIVLSFKDNLSTKNKVESLFLYFEALRKLGKNEQIVAEINDFLEKNPQSENKDYLERLLIYSYLELNRFPEAQQLAEPRLHEEPNNIQKIIDLAQVMKKSGDINEAISLLNRAKSSISSSSKFTDLMVIADEFFKIKLFEEACEVYEAFVDITQVTEQTHKMVEAYYRFGDIGKSLEICKALRDKFGPIIHITQIEIAIYHEINDLEKAKTVLTEYIECFPKEYDMKLDLAILNQKCNNYIEVDDFLEIYFDLNSLSIENCINLAILFNERGFFQNAIDILYELRRNNYGNEKVHLAYTNLMLFKSDHEEWLYPEEVGINTVVVIEEPTGKEINYIIEDRKDADAEKKELNVENEFSKILLGKRKGDKIVLKTPIPEEASAIKEIKSKYVHALQQSLEDFNYLFPKNQALYKMSVSKKGEDGISPDGLEKIKEIARLNSEHNKKVIGLYLEKRLTVWNVSKFCHKNVFDIWFDFTKDPDLGINCSVGSHSERMDAFNHITTDLRLVIDPLSLFTLFTLDIGDTIINCFGKMGVAQSTIDLFQQAILEQSRMYCKDHGVLTCNGDAVCLQEVSEESIMRRIEKLKCILEWTLKNCEILPCKKALSIKREEKKKYDMLIGRAFVDTILISCEEGNILYSEEKGLRDIAKEKFDTYGIWTQALLAYCLNRGFIEKSQYNKKIIELANLYYYHTSIDSEILVEAAKKANWKLAYPFINVLKILDGKNCDENSALNASLHFIRLIWEEQIPIEDFDLLFMSTLNTVVSGRMSPETIIYKLKIMITNRLDLFSLEDGIEIFELIKKWEMNYYRQIS